MRRLFVGPILVLMTVACTDRASEPFTTAVLDIGNSRKMYMECHGEGAPTVVLVSGKGEPSCSNPVPLPVTAKDGVADLHALLLAARVQGPYVVVGHSYGGLIARLYASTYPDAVAGLVLEDALS